MRAKLCYLFFLICVLLWPSTARADSVCLPLVVVRSILRPVTWATVTYIVDGDTFDVDFDGDSVADDRVRPIGIDTPETRGHGHCYSQEAKQRAAETLLGKQVALERDVRNRDTMENPRLLRYVYLADGMFWNALMVREGYAKTGCWAPDCKYYGYLADLQTQAEAEGAGGWTACAGEEWWVKPGVDLAH